MPPRRKLCNFVRFITPDQSTLKIPKKFTRDHRKQILLNPVLLIVSDDKVWPVGWTISGDGKLWLQKGWPEFHNHYCLKFGHLLYFKHLGKSIFHVRIFDPRYKELYKFPPENPKSKKQTDKSSKSFEQDNPCFSVTVRDSYLESSMLVVPVQFCRRYLGGYKKGGSCVLEMSDGGRWGAVDWRLYESFGKLYGQNWKRFSDENHLGVGDVCEFELVNDVENVMKVTISRA